MARILVIDDEPMVRDTIRQILEEAGFEIVLAKNGLLGEALYTVQPFDLVITDILMPEQEGIETIMNLRRITPDVKIIAVSGGGRIGNFEFLGIAKKVGANVILPKPFDLDVLISTVRDLLEPVPAA